MNRTILAATVAAVSVGTAVAADPAPKGPLDFTMKSSEGKDVKLGRYRGNVVLIVNTASKCGLTPQYDFTKFLVAPDGTTVKRYAPKTKPTEIVEDITPLLAD